MFGSSYSFGKACLQVYGIINMYRSIMSGFKSVVLNCKSPLINYSAISYTMLACIGTVWVTGNPYFAVGAIDCATAIIKS